MNNNFGEILKSILKEKNMSIYKLSQITTISKSHLYKIMRDEFEPSYYILLEISRALKIDIIEYYKISKDFETLEHYEKFIFFRELIEHNAPIEEVEDGIRETNLINVKDGMYKQLIHYLKALVMSKKYKRYRKSLEYCYLAIGLSSSIFNIEKLEKYISSEVSFNVLSLIQYNYFMLSEIEKSKRLSIRLIEVIENLYFNKNVPKVTISSMVFRTYIAMLNNYSDLIFNDKRYENVVENCEKAIEILQKNNSLYAMAYLLDMLLQANYMLGNYQKANEYYVKVKALCLVNEDVEHIKRIESRINNNYQILREV